MNTLSLKTAASMADVGATPLESRLRALGITPIPHSKIDAYKREQIRLNPPNLWGRLCHTLGIPTHEVWHWCPVIIIGIAILGFVVAIVGGFSALLSIALQPAASIPLLVVGLFGVALIIGALVIGTRTTAETIVRYPARWELFAWADGRHVPGWVMERKMVVSRNIPGLEYGIHELRQNEVDLDPILEAIDPETGERYAIAIWDEFGNEIVL